MNLDNLQQDSSASAPRANPTWTKNVPPGIRQNKSSRLWFFNKNICGRYVSECVSRIATDRETAVQLAEQRIVELRKLYQSSSSAASEPGRVTFADAVKRFKENLHAQVQRGERDLKTEERHLQNIEALLTTWKEKHGENLLELNPKKLLPREVEDWLTYFKSQAVPRSHNKTGAGRGYSGSSTNKVIAVFRKLFEIIITELNPTVINHAAKLPWISIQEKEPDLPCDEKWEQLKTLLRSGTSLSTGGNCNWAAPVADLVEGLEYTGCRLTELTSIEKSWIDLTNWSITIPSSAVKGRLGKKRGRVIGIVPQARLLFTRLCEEADSKTGKLFKVKHAYKTLRRGCEQIGIGKVTHHDIRKLFTTRCFEAGISPAVVAKWLGHKDGGKLALSVYTRVRPEALGQLTESLHFGRKTEALKEAPNICEIADKLKASLSPDQLEALVQQLRPGAAAAAAAVNN